MKVSAVVFEWGGSGHAERVFLGTMNSVRLAGIEPKEAIPEESVATVLEADPDYCHFVERGNIVLPQFYEAMTLACEHLGTDYAYCHCARVGGNYAVLETPIPDDLVMGQLLVKSWVVVELGSEGCPEDLMKRVLTEYRGTEVPHVLVLEISS